MTIDQLSYVLERKFTNIVINHDVIISCLTNHNLVEGVITQVNSEAFISEWRISGLDRPTNNELSAWWDVLRDQYESDPKRPDSAMFAFLKSRTSTRLPIILNTDI